MLHAEITSTEPTSNEEYISSLPQIAYLTPEWAHSWKQAAFPAISALRSGTRACAIILGESPERRVLFERDAKLKGFKIRLVKRELIVECYRLLGNKRSDFSDSDEIIVGRNAFYEHFLLKKKDLLGDFLSRSYSNPLTTPIPINDLLDLVNPVAMLKDANSSAHDITYDDVWLALLLMKEVDVADGKRWEKLAVLVINSEAVSSWRSNLQCVKSECKAKRDRMESHSLRKRAEEFEAARVLEQRRRLFMKLEAQGLVVSRQTFDDANDEANVKIDEANAKADEANANTAKLKTGQFITFILLLLLLTILFTKV